MTNCSHPMTPVQLPEVPKASHRFEDPEGDQPDILVYTADQLREYATEAVMAERRRVLAVAERWRADVRDKFGFGPIGHATLAHAGELEAILTPPEPNSGR